MKKRLIIEIGTNSIKALYCELKDNKWAAVSDIVYPARLGEGINKNGRISPVAQERNLKAIENIVSGLTDKNATEIHIIATESLRKADNADEFVIEVQARTGIPLEIVLGVQEARMSYQAVTDENQTGNQIIGVLDIGGGSTELALGYSSESIWQKSLPIGAVKQTEQFIKNYPPKFTEIKELEEHVKTHVSRYDMQTKVHELVGVGGTITALGILSVSGSAQAVPNIADIEGMKLNDTEIQSLITDFASKTLTEMQNMPGMPRGRADILLAGTIILQTVMRFLNVKEIRISIKGVRYGFLYSLA